MTTSLLQVVIVAAVVQTPILAQVRTSCLDSQFLSEPADEFERAFDVQFDRNANGASFSCDIFVRASEAHRALNRFRMGVLYESRDDLNASVTFPITAAVYDTTRADIPIDIFKLENADDFINFKRSEFDDALIGLISCANTINVMIRKSRTYGFAIGPGAIWFQPLVDVHPVKVTGITVWPISKEWVADECSIYYADFPETN